jgi:murein DD-endopeptidase MepM/ murein hydrolase activator NlpD
MRKAVLLVVVNVLALGLIGTGAAWRFASAAADQAALATAATGIPAGQVARRLSDIVLPKDSELILAQVPDRSTIAGMLGRHTLPQQETLALIEAMTSRFDVRRLRAGQPYRIDKLLDGRVRAFEYEIDDLRALRISRVFRAGMAFGDDGAATPAPGAWTGPRREGDIAFEAEVIEIPRTVATTVVEGTIGRDTPSLVGALTAAGERIDLALELADIFGGEIDFNSGLQPGDHFRLVVDKSVREDGRFAGYGPVQAAEFSNDGRALRAVRFTPPGGKPGYYDEHGRSLKRFFLKTPLKFEPRVTSSFSGARRHPVLNYTRAHNGVDYAAPSGAPVGAVASGTVTFAGWAGGGGRTVRVRHASGYESEYMHLSAIAGGIRPGVHVGQGELIGKVGASGLATGPHLHYGLRRDGRYVNPVREHQNLPPGEPVPALALAAFKDEQVRVFGLMQPPAQRALTVNE